MEFHPVVNNPDHNNNTIKSGPLTIDCPDSVRYGTNNYKSHNIHTNNNSTPRNSIINSNLSVNINSPRYSLLSPGRNRQVQPLLSTSLNLPVTPRYNPRQTDFHLTRSQVEEFRSSGALIVKANEIWADDELNLLLSSVNIMDNWPDLPGGYMKYYEVSKLNNEKILCRIENFLQYNPGINYFCNGNKLINATTQLFGEKSILYKEKINYKLPGAAGFAPHQDVAAGWWMYNQSLHISVLVCVDPATKQNGCLEVAFGEHKKGMLSDPWKELSSETESQLKFEAIETNPGDVIFFDSYVPHRSAPNLTNKSRRVLYATYAKSNEGDWRERYYADKRLSYPPDCERIPGKNYEYKV